MSDWDDAGNIDDYKPDNVIRDEDISLIAPPASVNASYDNIACVVSLLARRHQQVRLEGTLQQHAYLRGEHPGRRYGLDREG